VGLLCVGEADFSHRLAVIEGLLDSAAVCYKCTKHQFIHLLTATCNE